MKSYYFNLAFVLLKMSTSCNNTAIDQQAEAEQLMELSTTWAQSVQSKDVEKMLSYRANDAMVMSPNESAVVGKESLRGMAERSMNIPGFEINWEPQQA